jgi:predicted dehydrogenase
MCRGESRVPIKVGVIGCGRIANGVHLPNYARIGDVEIAALCDIDEKALGKAAEKYGVTNTFTSAEELLQAADVDAVSICTPNASHAPISIAALRAGKHVLCEKPLAMNAAEARLMLDEARRADVVNMVGFTHRFNPTMAFIKDVIAEGRLGNVHHLRVLCSVDRLMNPEVGLEWRMLREQSGSGALGDLASHMVDLSTFLMGASAGKISEVVGMTSIFVKHRRRLDGSGFGDVTADDAAAFIATYETGVMGVFEVSRFAPSRVHLEIDGNKGSLIYDSARMDTVTVKFQDSFADYFADFRPVQVPDSFLQKLGYSRDMFSNQIRHFVDGVRKRDRIKPDFADGLACQEILDAVLTSSATKTAQVIGAGQE